MQTTINYGFKKPDGTDEMKIADINDNFDSIDSILTHMILYGACSGSANAYTVTVNTTSMVYTEGMGIAIKINVDNTGASTINVNNMGIRAILNQSGNNLAAGTLKANIIYTLRYNGSEFIIQ